MNRHCPEKIVNINNNHLTLLTEYAGFWRRSVATLVDAIWIISIVLILLHFFDPLTSQQLYQLLDGEGLPINWKSIIINDMLPAILMIGLWYQYAATPGKWLVDCEIVDAHTGNPLSLLQAVVRYLAYLVSAAPLGLGFFWILWDKRKQGWHDKIARTVVIVHDDATIPLEQLMKTTVK